MNSLKTYIKDPSRILYGLVRKMSPLFSNDETYLKILYFIRNHRKLNLHNPQSYNEKLQWLKLYNRKPEYTTLVDKYLVKAHVSNIIGDEYIIPTLGVWNCPEDIEWDKLPQRFVLKTTDGGGAVGVVICKDKSSFNRNKAIKQLNKALKQNIYEELREWQYKNVKKRIIAEQFLEENGFESPRDYKVMCFDGKVKLIEYHEGRFSKIHTQDFYDRDWNLTKITQGSYGAYNTSPSPKPDMLDEMIRLSEVLAEGLPHIRVDWYLIDKHLYFGELTFFDGSGLTPWDRYEDELLLGSWITLPKNNYNKHI